jgi:S-DNA-T family DNA segregation ATPase FtsK/SpoIIIE
VLDHLMACWPQDQPKVWSGDLAARLAAHLPDLYTGWTGAQVTAAVKPHGVTSTQVKRTVDGQQKNKWGLARATVLAALADAPPTQEEEENHP